MGCKEEIVYLGSKKLCGKVRKIALLLVVGAGDLFWKDCERRHKLRTIEF